MFLFNLKIRNYFRDCRVNLKVTIGVMCAELDLHEQAESIAQPIPIPFILTVPLHRVSKAFLFLSNVKTVEINGTKTHTSALQPSRLYKKFIRVCF